MTDENTTGAWLITRVWSATGIQIDVKESGKNGTEAADRLYATIKHGIEVYGWKTENVAAPKAATQPDSSVPAPARVVSDTGINTLEVVRVEVTPKPDAKVELKLYAAGHKYPDLYHNGTVARVLTALSTTGFEWKQEMLEKSAIFDLHFFADWRNSEKLNTSGNPYKNVVGYRMYSSSMPEI